jgi:hypothetical protein
MAEIIKNSIFLISSKNSSKILGERNMDTG